jgi:DNA polymerase-3 subunit epsilon
MNLLDTPVRDAAWAALDFESAGAAPGRSDEPVQVGMAVWRGGEMTDFFRSYVHSDLRITRSARAVHGIGDDDVRNAPSMTTLWPEFKARLAGAVVVAHGAGTEKRFLRAFPLHGFGPWLDTLVLSRAVLPELGAHALGDVASALGVEEEIRRFCGEADWHDALFDAVACLAILQRVIATCASPDFTVGQLLAMDTQAYHRRRSLLQTARSAGWAT